MDTGDSQIYLLEPVHPRVIGDWCEKLEQQKRLRERQRAPRPEYLHQPRPNYDLLDEETLLASTLKRVNFLQLRPRRTPEAIDLLFQRGVSFAVA
jgi:hypothetical protein